MKHKYRGELNTGKVVNIFDFDGDIAKCDNGFGDININDFNTIFYPAQTFKTEVLGIQEKSVEEIQSDVIEETIIKSTRKKNS